jgi:hypothetical protein
MTFPLVPNRIPLYLDTEFTGLVPGTRLISLALVLSENNYFYAEFTDFDMELVDDWIRDNVLMNCKYLDIDGIPRIEGRTTLGQSTSYGDTLEDHAQDVIGPSDWVHRCLDEWLEITVENLCKSGQNPHDLFTIVSDCCMYDLVLFNNLFGGAFKVPKCINYIPIDICTMFVDMDIDPDISRREFLGTTFKDRHRHNALDDALEIKACYEKLIKMKKEKV